MMNPILIAALGLLLTAEVATLEEELGECSGVSVQQLLDGSVEAKADGWQLGLASTGALLYLQDNQAGENITQGNRGGCLWGVSFDDGSFEGSCGFATLPVIKVSDCTVQLTWANSPTSSKCIADVTVDIVFQPSLPHAVFDAQLSLTTSDTCAKGTTFINWISDLLIDNTLVSEALLPVLPGVVLRKSFWETSKIYVTDYPGRGVFADLIAIRTDNNGSLLMFTLPGEDKSRPVPAQLGFMYDPSTKTHYLHHVFPIPQTSPQNMSFTSPVVRVAVGWQQFPAASSLYSDGVGWKNYPSAADKAGPVYEQLKTHPLTKVDAVQFGVPFAQYNETLFPMLRYPVLVHTCGFEPNGFDRFYPDLIPPSPKFGTTQDLINMVKIAHQRGHIVMPYTNPTWWDPAAPTISKDLPTANLTLKDITAWNSSFEPVYESYGPNGGYVVEPAAQFVLARLDKLWNSFSVVVPFDTIFEDQIGARPWLPNYNPSFDFRGYIHDWIEHTILGNNRNLSLHTEQGFDRLLLSETGFYGSVLEMFLENRSDPTWGDDNWHTYPFGPMAGRDRVLWNQHNLAESTFTNDLSILTWNLMFGYQIAVQSLNLKVKSKSDFFHAAVKAQRYIVAPFVEDSLLDYQILERDPDTLQPTLTRTTFSGHTVTGSWMGQSGFPVISSQSGNHEIAPEGFYVSSPVLEAGSFISFNNQTFSDTTILANSFADSQIEVRMLLGEDCSLPIIIPASWTNITLTSRDVNGNVLAPNVPHELTGNVLKFDYQNTVGNVYVDNYLIQSA